MLLFAAAGVMGGLLRDLAPEKEYIWKFTPFPDLAIFRLLRSAICAWPGSASPAWA